MNPFRPAFPLCLLLGLATLSLRAQTGTDPATLRLEGEVTKPMTLGKGDLFKLKRTEHRAKEADGKQYTYSGYALADVLQLAGVTLGSQLKGDNLAKYLLVQASDGYEAVFALPELDPAFTDRVLFLADQRDGQPLPDSEGPYRIVVPGEKRHARWVRQVVTLKVLFAK
ncbi:MAG: molybdopterin-dependent oxidoreductase [Ferruginibacter sp.]|nr:molybdopterin-dependent oxidoreductase [Cytophagales bacterium]